MFALLTTSSQNLTIDRDLGKPLLVAPMVGGQVTPFAVVTTDSCPTIQWRVNGSVVSGALLMTPVPVHLLGLPHSTSLSPSLSPQSQQEHWAFAMNL